MDLLLLAVDQVSLSFGAVRALVDVSFGIREREILAWLAQRPRAHRDAHRSQEAR